MATIRKRGNSYQIRLSCGYDAKGNQVEPSMTWKPEDGMSERQIQKELNRQVVKFEEAYSKGQVASAAVKFETLAEEWLENHARLNLRHTSYARYLQLRPRIYPALGHLRIDKISARQIQTFITDLAVNGKNLRTGERLKRKSIQHHLIFISSVFRYAIRLDMLADNPCERVELPKEERAEKEIYTLAEVEQIFERLETDENSLLKVFVFLAVYSGFRRGELLGLEWRDVDWDNSVVSVRRTSNYSTHKGTYTDTTKTKKSQRSIQLPPIIMDMLADYKAAQDLERVNIGDKWEESGRIFTSWCGKPLTTTLPYKWFKKFCEKNGFRFCDLHSMRHFNASALINAGIDVVSVSHHLGHTAVATTSNIYCHLFQEAQARTSNAIANALDFKGKKAV